MSQPQLIIRNKKPPQRCEICHLADQFDPLTETCQRCAGLLPAVTLHAGLASQALPPSIQEQASRWVLYSFCAMILLAMATVVSAVVGAYPLVLVSGVFTLLFTAVFIFVTLLFTFYMVYQALITSLRAAYDSFRSKAH